MLWSCGFLCTYENTATFEARMLKSHLPMQHAASAKTGAEQSSPLECLRKPNVPLTERKPNAFRETDVWAEDLKMAFQRPFFFFFSFFFSFCQNWRGCMTKAILSFGKKRLLYNTASLSHREFRLMFKSQAMQQPAHIRVIPTHCALTLECRRPLSHKKKKKSFQKYATIVIHKGRIETDLWKGGGFSIHGSF